MKLRRLLLIVIGGSLLGLAWNAASGRGFALARNVLIKDGDQIVSAAEARARLEKGALFLDARPIAFYNMSHILGALPLPEDDFEAAYARLAGTLAGRFDVIVYCAGFGCEASHIVSRKLKARGVPAVILDEGWPAWTDAGYPVTDGPQP